MKDGLIERLKEANKALTESYTRELLSPNGRRIIRVYSPESEIINIPVCETQEDVHASKEGRW